jgi:hypothetical protein
MKYQVQFTPYWEVKQDDELKITAQAFVYKVKKTDPENGEHIGERHGVVLPVDATVEQKEKSLEEAAELVLKGAQPIGGNEEQLLFPDYFSNAKDAANAEVKGL